LADTLAKEAAQDDEERNRVYDRIPISTIATGIKEEGLKKCNEGEQSVEHLIHACRILEPHRSFLIQHITTRGGIWPPTNNELVAKYLNAFSRFVKSMDFSKL
jgi:hypothetical protein